MIFILSSGEMFNLRLSHDLPALAACRDQLWTGPQQSDGSLALLHQTEASQGLLVVVFVRLRAPPQERQREAGQLGGTGGLRLSRSGQVW